MRVRKSVSLSGGSFDADYAASDLQGLSEVKTESVFDVSGKLTGVTFTGIEYGRALSEFYANILLDKEGTAVLTVPLTVLFDAALSPIVRSGYELDGIYNGENAYDVSAAVTRALSLIAHWTPDTSSIDEDYFENTFEFEKLIDGTYAITRVKDARAALVYVPAEYKGLPVTRIEANAAKDNSSVTTLDLTKAFNLTYIGANAFGGCVSLSDIRSDAETSKLSRIEAGAFDGINYDLRKNGHLIVGNVLVLAKTNGGDVNLSSEPFEYIAGGAFSDTSLTKLTLPDGLKGIADGAFAAANPTGDIAIETRTTSMEYLGSDIGLESFSDGKEDNRNTAVQQPAAAQQQAANPKNAIAPINDAIDHLYSPPTSWLNKFAAQSAPKTVNPIENSMPKTDITIPVTPKRTLPVAPCPLNSKYCVLALKSLLKNVPKNPLKSPIFPSPASYRYLFYYRRLCIYCQERISFFSLAAVLAISRNI